MGNNVDAGGFPASGQPVIAPLRALGRQVFQRTDYLIAAAANASITFSSAPLVSQGTPLKLFKNGAIMFYGVDYTLVGNKATFTLALTVGDKIVAEYYSTNQQAATTLSGARAYDAWNPGDKNAGETLSNSNLTATDNLHTATWSMCRSTQSKNTGKYYIEFTLVAISTGTTPGYSGQLGVATSAAGIASNQYVGFDNNGWGFGMIRATGSAVGVHNAANTSLSSTSGSAGLICGMAVDLDAGKLWISKAGVWDGSAANPATGATATYSFTPNISLFLAVSNFGSASVTLNAGASAFTYTVPTGFNAGWYQDS